MCKFRGFEKSLLEFFSHHLTHFMRRFRKIAKIDSFSFMSGSPSAWNSSAATGRIFMKFYVQVFFENLSYKIHVSLKCDKNNEYFT